MQYTTLRAAALTIALIGTAGAASAQPMATPKPMSSATPNPIGSSSAHTKKSTVAHHGPPIDAAGANAGSSSNPQSGTNVPSTTGATH